MNTNELLQMATAIRDEIKTASITPERLGTILVELVSAIGDAGSSGGGSTDVLGTKLAGLDTSLTYKDADEALTVLQAFGAIFGRMNDGKKMRIAISPSGFIIGLEKTLDGTISTLVLFDLKGKEIYWKSNNSYDITMMSDATTLENMLKSEGTQIPLHGSGGSADVLGTKLTGLSESGKTFSYNDEMTLLAAIANLIHFSGNAKVRLVHAPDGVIILGFDRYASSQKAVIGIRFMVTETGMDIRYNKSESDVDYVKDDEVVIAESASWTKLNMGQGGGSTDVLGTKLAGLDTSLTYKDADEALTVLQAFGAIFGRMNDGKKMRIAISPSGFIIGLEKTLDGTISTLVLFDLKGKEIYWKSNNSYDITMMSDATTLENMLKSEGTQIPLHGSGGSADVLGTKLTGLSESGKTFSYNDEMTLLAAIANLIHFSGNAKVRLVHAPDGVIILGFDRYASSQKAVIGIRFMVTETGMDIRYNKSESDVDYVKDDEVVIAESASWTKLNMGQGGGSTDVLNTVLSGFGDTQRQSSVKDTSTVLQAISTLSYLVNNGRFKTVSDGTGFLLLSSSEAEGTGTVSGLRVTINDEGDMELRASKLEGATGSKSWFMMGDETIMGISAQWPLVSGGGIGIKNVTFDELKAAVEAGTLETGYRYRLIDYECKTSSGHPVEQHPFNIVFEAVSPNNLSEYACAERKEDDEYYTSNDLSKWKIKFSFDAAGYDWVTADSGFKGVIYYMKDEYGNSAGYDFKQIKVGNTSRLSNIYYKDGLAGNKSKVAQAVADMLYSSASDIIVCGQRYGSSSISGDYKKAGVSGGASVLPSSSQYVKLFGESENAIVAAVANTAVGVGESTSVYAFGGNTENDYSISGITRNCHVEGHGPRGNVFKNVCTNCSIGENVSNSVLSGDYITIDGNSVGNILFGDRLAVHDGKLCHVLGNSSGIEIESSTDVAIGPSCDGCSASSVSFAGIGGNCGNVAVSDMEIFLCNGICVDLDISGIDSLIIGANSSGIRSLGSSFTQVNEIPAYSKGIVIMNRTQPLSYSELGFVPSETECLQNLLVTDGDAAGVLSDLTGLTDTYFKILRGSSIIPSRPDSELSGTSENPVQNKAIKAALDKKQDTLVSGTNMKTLNGLSLLGAGGIVIEDKQLYTVYGNVPEGNTIIPGQIWVIEQDPDSAMSSIITVNKVNISSSVGEQKVSLMDSYIYASDNINFVFNAASVLNFAVYKKDFGNPPGKGGKRKYTLNWVTKGTSQFVVIDCENFE